MMRRDDTAYSHCPIAREKQEICCIETFEKLRERANARAHAPDSVDLHMSSPPADAIPGAFFVRRRLRCRCYGLGGGARLLPVSF